MDINKIIAALKLAEAARKFADAVFERESAQLALDNAYLHWKRENGIGFVEKHSAEWEHMLADTGEEYLAVRRAKRREQYRRDALVKQAKGGA
jgi:hypothetical protein